MEGRMKRLGKYKAVIALLCFTATIFSGCRKKPDAVQIYLRIKILR